MLNIFCIHNFFIHSRVDNHTFSRNIIIINDWTDNLMRLVCLFYKSYRPVHTKKDNYNI